jgi:hypothetical protein
MFDAAYGASNAGVRHPALNDGTTRGVRGRHALEARQVRPSIPSSMDTNRS